MQSPVMVAARKRLKLSFGIVLCSAALLGTVIVALVGLGSLAETRDAAVSLAQTRSRNLARSADEAVTSIVQRVEHTLLTVAGALELAADERDIERASMTRLLRLEETLLAEASAIWVTDASGQVVLGTSVEPSFTSFADHEFFRALSDQPNPAVLVTRPIYGLLSDEWAVVCATHYQRQDGRFGGVVVAPVALQHFENALHGYDVGPGGLRILRDTSGGFVASHPAEVHGGKLAVGSTVAAPPLEAFLASQAPLETGYSDGAFDGIPRTYTLRRINAAPMVVVAALSEQDYLAQWHRDRVRIYTMSAAAIIAIWTLAVVLWWLWRARERNAHALEASEAKYRGLVETAQELVWKCDPHGRFVYLNPTWVKTFGYPLDEMLGRNFRDFQPPEAAARDWQEFARMLRGGSVKEYETSYLTKDGRELTLLFNAVAERNARDEVIGTQGTAEDITERKLRDTERAEALHALQCLETIDRIIQRAGIGTLPSMLDEVLSAMLDIFGSDAAWLLHAADPDGSVWRVHSERKRSCCDSAIAPGLPVELEASARAMLAQAAAKPSMVAFGAGYDSPLPSGMFVDACKSQAVFPITLKYGAPWALGLSQCSHPRVWTAAEGNLLVQIGLRIADGLNTMLFLEEVQASENRFRTTLAQLSEGCMIIDFDETCLYANDVAGRHGVELSGELVGRTIPALYAADSTIPEHYRTCLQQREPQRFEEVVAGVDAGPRIFTFTVTPVPEGIFVLSMDVTEARRQEQELATLEQKLVKAQRLDSLGSLAGGVAHDMNNALSAILAMSSLQRDRAEPGSALAHDLASISQACQRAASLVKGLLGFARQDVGRQELVDLNELVREQVALLERTTLHRLELVTRLDEKLGSVRGDPGALAHALMNVCVNAADSMPGGGTLTISTRNEGSTKVLLEVADTGCGMPAAVLDKSLDPFFTTKPQGKGTGLGLSMVYGAVKSHGGELDIDSEPQVGTTVAIRLPAATAAPAGTAARDTEPEMRALSILLVDDDDLVRNSVARLLTALGHTLALAASGELALEQLAGGFVPDVVLLDLNMPGLGGAATLARIRADHPELPVLLVTGRADQSASELVESVSHVTLMPKPFSLAELGQQLSSVVRPQ